MPGLYLVSGNRLELLAGRCASVFSEEPLPPMTKEIIVLQSMGMMQWLSIQLAESLGIWADFEYILPNRMTSILMKSFFPGLGDERFFDREIMTWKTMKILRGRGERGEFRKLHDYLNGDLSGIKEFQLASRITDLLDQYMTFRPDMILRWDRGEYEEGEEWQPLLWRELTSGMSGDHPPALLERLFTGIASGTVERPADLPHRVSVFGVSYLPLYHLNVLRAVSLFCDVYLYMLNPCSEYWVDIMREKEITSLVMKKPIVAESFESDLHIERGNPLLSSMGRTGRDFFRFLYMSDIESGEEQFFEDPGADSILRVIQGDILAMRRRGDKRGEPQFILSDKAAAEDFSVVINSCHSVMREVEVLHDYLLDLFNTTGITPGDVLVMTPDIEACSSIVQGVFDRREEGLPRIPYRIVDRRMGNTSRAVDAFMKILSLPDGRFTATDVMGILQCPDILRRFNLSGDDFDSIGLWVRGTGIYWGIDSGYRGSLGLPEIHENTWSFGIERMLLGSVMSCGDETSLGILPYPEIEGGDMQVLGRFISFFRLLTGTCYRISGEHSPDHWGVIISGIAEGFFEGDADSSGDLLEIVKCGARLREIAEASGFSGRVGLPAVREFIEKSLSAASAGRNFITGNLTFCEMLPMRSIPCKVICLIGMNEYSFPRKGRPSGFDLMMKKPRRGDRSVRDEDRYLFLETVISARERLYISYTGQNITTNTDQNPSIVVSELMDCIDESLITESGTGVSELIFRKQRIQAYHPVYFTKNSGYYSFSRARLEGASSYTGRRAEEYAFFTEPLPPLSDDERDITVDDLGEFLVNPARYLIRKRLGVNLDYYADDYKDDEPFVPESLEMYGLEDRILRLLEKGDTSEAIFNKIKAEGILPHGSAGSVIYSESFRKIGRIYGSVRPLLVNASQVDSIIDLESFRLKVKRTVYDRKFVFYRGGKLRPKDRLMAWVYHIAACSTGRYGDDFGTLFIAADEKVRYNFADDALRILGELAALYEEGMTRPIPLFPYSSYEFALGITEKDEKNALGSAAGKLRNPNGISDMSDPYIARLFGDFYAPDSGFIELAKRVYSPMIGHQGEWSE